MKTIKNVGLWRGKKHKTTKKIDNTIINKVRGDHKTGPKSIQKEIEEFSVSVSSRLVCHRLNKYGYYTTIAPKKSLITSIQLLKRLDYAYIHLATLYCGAMKQNLIYWVQVEGS